MDEEIAGFNNPIIFQQHNLSAVTLLDDLLETAISKNISDIHFEPYEQNYRIRFREDSVLRSITTLPLGLAIQVITRLKVLSQINITESRLPQDGHFQFPSLNKKVDFRVSTCPTVVGEKVVLRLLNADHLLKDLNYLGLSAQQQAQLEQAIEQPQGMILVTGPTGSGKTVTLYSALNRLNREQKNIATIENPVEIHVAGINQLEVNPKIGLNFAQGLRALLRQDPDILMVGEIRDAETTEIAFKAAQTGHLVLSTLHTNNAAQTLVRLINLKVSPFILATTLTLVIAQRLVRKLCDHCKMPGTFPSFLKEKMAMDDFICYKPNHCIHCNNGYRGQIGLFEILPMTSTLRNAILANHQWLEIEQLAQQEGMITLSQAALNQVKMGVTSYQEVTHLIKNNLEEQNG